MYIVNVHVWSVKCRACVIIIQIKNFHTSEIFWCFRETIHTNHSNCANIVNEDNRNKGNHYQTIVYKLVQHYAHAYTDKLYYVIFWSVALSSLMMVWWPPTTHVGI